MFILLFGDPLRFPGPEGFLSRHPWNWTSRYLSSVELAGPEERNGALLSRSDVQGTAGNLGSALRWRPPSRKLFQAQVPEGPGLPLARCWWWPFDRRRMPQRSFWWGSRTEGL